MPRKPASTTLDTPNSVATLHALEIERGNMVLFSASPPPKDVRDGLLALRGGRTCDGVSLEVPKDVDWTPQGGEIPDAELCVDASNPRRFRVFKYNREVPGSGFVPTGKGWTFMESTRRWRKFLNHLRRLDEIGSYTDETDNPETWAIVQRLIDSRYGERLEYNG